MVYTAWVTLASLVLYFWTTANVGRARARLGVKAPATDGPEKFQRILRVQANTLEQLALFLPALWLCGLYLDDRMAAGAGALWVVGRVLYALGYYRQAEKRHAGFMIGLLASVILLAGAVWGLVTHGAPL